MFFDLFKKKNKENAKIQELEQTIRNLSAELEAVKRNMTKDEKWNKQQHREIQKMEQPLSKPAENKFDVTGVTHGLEIVDGVVKGYSGTSSDINIPEGVTEIEYNHLTRHGIFDGKIITRIFLPKSLKIIRPSSFRDCSSLEYINIPPNLDKVGDAALWGCSKLQTAGISGNCNIMLSPEMKKIPENLFSGCKSLKSVVLPTKIESIEKNAFFGCNCLEKLYIPSTCKFIGHNAFYGCRKLKELEIASESITFDGNAFQGCESLADKNGFVIVKDTLFFYTGHASVVSIPYGIKEIACDAIGGYTFNSKTKNIVEIMIPDSVTTIGDYAFGHCENLKKITIPDSVQNIGKNILYHCDSLEELIVSEHAPKELKDYADTITPKITWRRQAEEKKRLLELAKTRIDNKSDLTGAVRSFVKHHNGNTETGDNLVRYIIAKLGTKIYHTGEWYFFEEKIEYKYEWAAHSFFDDGGGEEGLINWTMSVNHNACLNFENDKLFDCKAYPEYTGKHESFVCKNPFGLVGSYEFTYRSYRSKTD